MASPSSTSPLMANDSDVLQKISPEEIWLLIVKKEFTSQAENDENFLKSLGDSSDYFKSLLPKRVLYLFKMVFKLSYPWILARTEHDTESSSDSDTGFVCDLLNDDGPRNNGRRTKSRRQERISVVKGCSKVCSVWNTAVDKLIYKNSIRHKQILLHSLEVRVLRFLEFETFEHSSQVIKFMHFFQGHNLNLKFGSSHKNEIKYRSPFVSRRVQISFSCFSDGTNQPEEEALKSILKAFGHHIFDLKFNINGIFMNVEQQLDIYALIVKCIQLVPNLKSLSVHDTVSSSCESQNLAILGKDPKLKLPHLGNLVELTTSKIPAPILGYWILNNDHIAILKIERSKDATFDITNLRVQNLKTFALNFWSIQQVKLFNNFKKPWLLTELILFYSNVEKFFDYTTIFKAIGTNWGSSLTHLHLYLPQAQSYKKCRKVLRYTANSRLELPHLQYFRLNIFQPFFLDFLLPTSTSLKRLIIFQTNSTTALNLRISKSIIQKELIHFLGLGGRLLNSNIWKLFPKLEYTRTCGCKIDGGSFEECTRSGSMLSKYRQVCST